MASLVYLFLAILATASAAPGSRIQGGEPIAINDTPYIVAFTYHYPNAGITIQRCVGSLISSYHVLNSAFCYYGAVLENLLLRAGSTNSLEGGTTVMVDKFVLHPEYTMTPRTNDLAVSFLAYPLGITDTIGILYLPHANYEIPDGSSLQVVGWGFDAAGSQSETLLSVYMNKVNLGECQAIYADEENINISDNIICASAPGKGTCNGDSGAPMVLNNVIVGHSSIFNGCGDDSYPDLFTRNDRYSDWIMAVSIAGRSGKGYMAAPVRL